ncbi:MAG TPA: hypothetical protein VHR66_04560 [Gemmataceae bacterium]|jgi:hypothetical protein|nr:hypothetical protein [Gemmataceae bacterium]
MSDSPAPAVRRRKNDRSEIPVSFLPEGNANACRAYVCALIGLVPGLGLVFGLPAILFGVLGRRAALRDEFKRGLGHAYVSRLMGLGEFVFNVAGVACLIKASGAP